MTLISDAQTRAQNNIFLEAERETLKRLKEINGVSCFAISEAYEFKATPSAPLMHVNSGACTGGGSYSCPDIIAYQNNKPFFVEVKYREKTINYNGAEEMAIKESNYSKYYQIENATGAPVWLAFYQPHKSGQAENATIFFIKLSDFTRVWDGTNAKTGEKITNADGFYMYDLRHTYKLFLPRNMEIKTFI